MREIQLTMGCVALVDDNSFAELSQHKWHAIKSGATFYAARHGHPTGEGLGKVRMHRTIIGAPQSGLVVDHVDGNGLNNQRGNLRFVTARQNQQNQKLTTIKKHSKYPGVSRCDIHGWQRWVAGAKINGKRKTLGYFTDERAAYEAYCVATNTIPEAA